MIEAELKARLTNPAAVRAALDQLAEPEKAIYRDTYYDTPDGAFDAAGRELRLRTVETPDVTRHLLTFKEPAVDQESGSKPEYETTVATPAAVAHMLEALGYVPAIELTKHCLNYQISDDGRDFTATVVEVPELDGTFLEIETIVLTSPDQDHVAGGLAAVRDLLHRVGVADEELTTELYTDAVRLARE